jgi:hypothetical protein
MTAWAAGVLLTLHKQRVRKLLKWGGTVTLALEIQLVEEHGLF